MYFFRRDQLKKLCPSANCAIDEMEQKFVCQCIEVDCWYYDHYQVKTRRLVYILMNYILFDIMIIVSRSTVSPVHLMAHKDGAKDSQECSFHFHWDQPTWNKVMNISRIFWEPKKGEKYALCIMCGKDHASHNIIICRYKARFSVNRKWNLEVLTIQLQGKRRGRKLTYNCNYFVRIHLEVYTF